MSISNSGHTAPVRIVIAEDACAKAASLGTAVKRSLPGGTVVRSVDSLEDTRRALVDMHPDVLLLELELRGTRGVGAYQAVRSAAGDAAVLVVTASSDLELGLEAVSCGADDCIVKDRSTLRDIGATVLVALARKRAAVQMRQIAELQRLEAVSRLGRGIAHHFNNLAQIVLGYASLALETKTLPREVSDALDVIVRATRRNAVLTQHLLDFTSAGEAPSEIVDAQAVVRAVMVRVYPLLPPTVELEASFADTPAWVRIERLELEQVLVALMLNAVDATPSNERIRIGVSRLKAAGVPATRRGKLGADQVVVTVSDTGKGMSPEVQRRALEPFFTTKDVGRGAGMGLSAVHGMVRRAGGFVSVSSFPGHGTTVRIYLPRAVPASGGNNAACRPPVE